MRLTPLSTIFQLYRGVSFIDGGNHRPAQVTDKLYHKLLYQLLYIYIFFLFQTLVLLYNMTNCVNVQPVCDKLLEHMVNSNDSFHKEDLLHKIIELIYKYPLLIINYIYFVGQI